MSSYAVFNVEGMHCANCAASVEKAVLRVRGVKHVSVNAATSHASVEWEDGHSALKSIFEAVRKAGFKPMPLAGEAAGEAERMERRAAIKRIGIAGLGMMQTMMFIYALYAGGAHGIEPRIEQYLRLTGLLFATPVLFYSGSPFLLGALRDLRGRKVGMDVPVAVALLLAYSLSVVNTLRGSGQVYFDSVTMFIFFLSGGRFLEMLVRQRSLSATDALSRSLPTTVTRVKQDGAVETVPLSSVRVADRLIVPMGAVVPADCVLESDTACLDEALITGESKAVFKTTGAGMLGGSVNTGRAINIRATAPADRSTLAAIVGLLQRAQAQRASVATVADRAASVFSVVTLALAALVAIAWAWFDPTRAVTATLAVLVITCPCALSLATPATVAAATARLARSGLLVLRPDALERLAKVDTIVFDKTGTLTREAPIAAADSVAPGWTDRQVLRIAAALERGSGHPIAAAFAAHADPKVAAVGSREYPGEGIEGEVEGRRWRIGQLSFVAQLRADGGASAAGGGTAGTAAVAPTVAARRICLSNDSGLVATFEMAHVLQAGVQTSIDSLRNLDLEVIVASGDTTGAVNEVGGLLRIRRAFARMSPQAKLALVERLQGQGRRVLMVGDGINDGPVLAAAFASCAMGQGSAIAQSASDLLLINPSLTPLAEAVLTARAAMQTLRQNLAWAFAYNVASVPLAALGWVAPWIAAIGMSLSSLAVVGNAARLANRKVLRS